MELSPPTAGQRRGENYTLANCGCAGLRESSSFRYLTHRGARGIIARHVVAIRPRAERTTDGDDERKVPCPEW
jgi:hypothetical protein